MQRLLRHFHLNAGFPFAIAAAVGAVVAASPALAAGCGGRVQTGYGSSALALAQRCGVTLQELERANPMINGNEPLNGAIVTIPNLHPKYIPDSVARGAPPASSVLPPVPHSHPAIRPLAGAERQPVGKGGKRIYIIHPGDTLSGIAARANVPLGRLMAANPGVDPRRLAVGRAITVPAID